MPAFDPGKSFSTGLNQTGQTVQPPPTDVPHQIPPKWFAWLRAGGHRFLDRFFDRFLDRFLDRWFLLDRLKREGTATSQARQKAPRVSR